MKIPFRFGIVLLLVGIVDLLWTLWRVHEARANGVGAVGGAGIPLVLIVFGLAMLVVAVSCRAR